MKEQELRQALQRMATPASFSDENRRAVFHSMQRKGSMQSIRLPVPRKRSMALVMLIVLLVMTVGAMAVEGWGILSFLRDRGKTPSADQLLPLESNSYPPHRDALVDAVITEALHENGTLYLTVTMTPLEKNTLVVPMPNPNLARKHMNLNNMNMRAAMQDDAYDENVSVLDYAKSKGFEYVVLMDFDFIRMTSTQAHWSKDKFSGLEDMEFNLLADGTLQFILQVGYQPNLAFSDPSRVEEASVQTWVYKYDLKENGKWQYGTTANASAQIMMHDTQKMHRSLPEDAHDIVGYIGAVEYISIAPYDDEYMAITIQVNLGDEKTEDIWMSGPAWIIMDAEGNRLCEVDETKFYGLRTDANENGDRMHISHGLFPVEYMPKDNKITLRAEHHSNYNIVYDEYTYTLTNDQAAEDEALR